MELFQIYLNEIIIAFTAMLFILFVWNIVLQIKITGLKKRFVRFTRGNLGENLEEMIIAYTKEITDIKNTQETNSSNIRILFSRLDQVKGNVGVVRYNAFADVGSDLSYSIAILDDQKNGVVITSIYNREQSNTYAKPVEKGESTYRLSNEEKKAIELAINK